jgi:hypothetical protein
VSLTWRTCLLHSWLLPAMLQGLAAVRQQGQQQDSSSNSSNSRPMQLWTHSQVQHRQR